MYSVERDGDRETGITSELSRAMEAEDAASSGERARRFLMFRSRCMAKHSFPYKPICFKCKATFARARARARKDER